MDTQIIQDWLKDGIELNPPATINEITNCETKVDFSFPEDFKIFYKTCNGFKNWAMDSKCLSLWPLDKIMSDYQNSDFIPFCDYLANGSQIGFIKMQPGIYKNYDRSLICTTFEEFLDHWRKETNEYF
jgi:cell wall assembly regulator SMI1